MAPLEEAPLGVVVGDVPPLGIVVEGEVAPLAVVAPSGFVVGFELEPTADIGVPVGDTLDETAEEAKLAPTAFAPARKAENELFVPSAPGLTANTIPLPQWLAAVNSLCRQ